MQIHELPEAASVDDTDQIAIDTGAITKKFSVLGLLRKISERVTVYTAAWTATASSAINTRLTDAISLPAGTYLAVATTPIRSSGGGIITIAGTGVTVYKIVDNDYVQMCVPFTLSTAGSVAVFSASSSAMSFTNVDRGWLRVIKLA